MWMGWSCVVVAALSLPAAAAEPPSDPGRAALARFNAFDRDGDGALSRAELLARGRETGADALFVMLDADGDGRLSAREVEGTRAGRGGGGRLARFDAYDVDRNGWVTRREFPAFPDPLLLAALDADGDGRIGLNELRPTFAGMRPDRAEQPARPVSPSAAEPPRRPPCWVPTPADGQWGLEMPVVRGRCGG